MTKTVRWVAVLALAAALTIPMGRLAAQDCGGYCQTQGTCPASGKGCGSGLCCYCCYNCVGPVCSYGSPCAFDSQHEPIFWEYLSELEVYNCYKDEDGQKCVYDHTSTIGPFCNGNICPYCPAEV